MTTDKGTSISNCLLSEELLTLGNLLIILKHPVIISGSYKNWRGETSTRIIRCQKIWYGSTSWHPEKSIMLTAYDYDKKDYRDFCLKDFDFSSLRSVAEPTSQKGS